MNTKLMYTIGGLMCLAGILVGGLRSVPAGLAIGWTGAFILGSSYCLAPGPGDTPIAAPREMIGGGLACPRCQSEHITVQVVTESQLERVRHGAIWWVLVGWWWVPVKWIFLTFPALIIKIFAPKKHKISSTHKSIYVCQSCGNMWESGNEIIRYGSRVK